MGGDVRRNDPAESANHAPETEPPHASMTPMRALLVETVEDGRPSRRIDPRNLVMGALMLVTMVSVAVAVVSLLASDPPAVTGSLESPPAPPSTGPSTSPGEDVAGSNRLVTDFDLLPTDSAVEAWSLSDGARLLVAALPTAVDRSARLEGIGRASACRDLGVAFSTFEVMFMLDAVPAGGVTLFSLEIDDGSAQRVSLSDGRVTVAAIGDGVELQVRTWYRWVVRSAGEELRMSLRSADGSPLAEAVGPGLDPGARATEFCMTTLAPSRLYLNEMNVETP